GPGPQKRGQRGAMDRKRDDKRDRPGTPGLGRGGGKSAGGAADISHGRKTARWRGGIMAIVRQGAGGRAKPSALTKSYLGQGAGLVRKFPEGFPAFLQRKEMEDENIPENACGRGPVERRGRAWHGGAGKCRHDALFVQHRQCRDGL